MICNPLLAILHFIPILWPVKRELKENERVSCSLSVTVLKAQGIKDKAKDMYWGEWVRHLLLLLLT